METNPNTLDQEISLREYILKTKSYFYEVLRYWYIPLVLAAAFATWKLYEYSNYISVYPARITFMVDEDEAGGSSGLTGMLGQFGLGGVRPARYNLDKILELSRSRKVVQQTLFAKINVQGKDDYLANHLIRIYDVNTPGDNEREQEGYFRNDSVTTFSREENEVLLSVYNLIIGPAGQPDKALLSADYNEDTNIMSLTASTTDETLSLELSRRMFESLSNFYVSKAIEKSLKTYKIVSAKRDSVLGELRAAEYALANFIDRHHGLLMRTDEISRLRLQREVASLTAMYGEVVKNAEIADFSLKSKTPFIQVIDTPIAPLSPTSVSLVRQIAMGLLIGGLIGVGIIILRRIYYDVMSRPQVTSTTLA